MSVLHIVVISFILELLEVYFQYGKTLKTSLMKLYNFYNKTPFLFFASHLGYIWILFVSISYSNLNWPIIIAIALKTFDIFTKIELIKKFFLKPDVNYISEVSPVLELEIPFWVYMVGPLTYPYLIYLAFN